MIIIATIVGETINAMWYWTRGVKSPDRANCIIAGWQALKRFSPQRFPEDEKEFVRRLESFVSENGHELLLYSLQHETPGEFQERALRAHSVAKQLEGQVPEDEIAEEQRDAKISECHDVILGLITELDTDLCWLWGAYILNYRHKAGVMDKLMVCQTSIHALEEFVCLERPDIFIVVAGYCSYMMECFGDHDELRATCKPFQFLALKKEEMERASPA